MKIFFIILGGYDIGINIHGRQHNLEMANFVLKTFFCQKHSHDCMEATYKHVIKTGARGL